MNDHSTDSARREPMPRGAAILRGVLAGLLGVGGALLVSCGSSGASLIPVANAGPLKSDFEEVARAAQNGNGSCAATEAAILKTTQDYAALPASVDGGLRSRLQEGIANLRERARAQCAETLGASTPTTTTTKSTPTTTTPTTTTSTTTTPTTTTSTTTTPTGTTTTPTTTGSGGGTVAPGEGSGAPGAGESKGGGSGGAVGGVGQENGK
jgi:cytoskeletal protein RodZ